MQSWSADPNQGNFRLFPAPSHFIPYYMAPVAPLPSTPLRFQSSFRNGVRLECVQDEAIYRQNNNLDHNDGLDLQDFLVDERKAQTKAKRKISVRSSIACDRCRKRKSRCSGEIPCVYCISTGQECVDTLPKRVQSVNKLARPPRNYLHSLENRFQALANAIKKIASQTDVSLQDLNWEAVGDVVFDPKGKPKFKDPFWDSKIKLMTTKLVTAKAVKPASLAEFVRLEGWDSENTDDHMRYFGRGSDFTFADTITARYARIPPSSCRDLGAETRFSQSVGPTDSTHTLLDTVNQSFFDSMVELPSMQMQRSLLDAYFEQVNTIFPIIHRMQFEKEYQAGLLNTDLSFKALVYCIFALASRYVDEVEDPSVPPDLIGCSTYPARGWQYFKFSYSYGHATSMLPGHLRDLQCNTLQILWLVTACTPSTTWVTTGIAVRRAVDAGLHVENGRWQRSVIDDQLRKRIFHILFTFDQTLCAMSGRPLAFQHNDSDIDDPLDISDESLDEWDKACKRYKQEIPYATSKGRPPAPACNPSNSPGPVKAILMLSHLLKLFTKLMKEVYGRDGWYDKIWSTTHPLDFMPEIHRFEGLLDAWEDDLPEGFVWQANRPDNQMCLSTTLHSYYYHVRITLYRELLLSYGRAAASAEKRARFFSRSFPVDLMAKCNQYIKKMHEMYATVSRRGLLPRCTYHAPSHLTMTALMSLSLASIQVKVFDIALDKTDEFQTANKLISILNELVPLHPLAAWLSSFVGSILRRLYPSL